MFTVDRSIDIARPPAVVFGFATDVDNDHRWRSDLIGSRIVSGGRARAGAVIENTVQFLGTRTFRWDITEFEPDRRQVTVSRDGPLRGSTVTATCEPHGAGTRFRMVMAVHTHGPMRLMAPLLPRDFDKKFAGFLTALKDIVERTPPHHVDPPARTHGTGR